MILRAEKLHKSTSYQSVIHRFSITLGQGEIVSLFGPIQSGKNTCLLMMSGMLKPTRGDIYLDNQKITSSSKPKRVRTGIHYAPQEPNINPRLTVEQNIISSSKCMLSNRDIPQHKLETVLTDFNLSSFRKVKVRELQEGERRKTQLARILIQKPKFILLNEPFSGIPPKDIEDLKHAIFKLREKNIGILITDHHMEQALPISDRAYYMFHGRQFHFHPMRTPVLH